MVKLAISGCCGRMGSRILELALKYKDCKVVCIWERKNHPSLNSQIHGFTVTDQSEKIKNADCLIEFTLPRATMDNLKLCVKYKKAMVIGTTGLTDSQKKEIVDASNSIPIVFSPNMSIGVNVLFKLLKEASSMLTDDYKINIVEAHHIHKKDAPSGTAKQLAKIIEDVSKRKNIDIKSLREGEIIGDHKIIFDGPLDSIELLHSAKSRDIFVQGAIIAAKWVVTHKKGLFDMQDILKKGK